MSTETRAPTETARAYRSYNDFTDPMIRAAATQVAAEVGPWDPDSLRWLGYADQELTRLRELLGLDVRPGYASGRPQYERAGSR